MAREVIDIIIQERGSRQAASGIRHVGGAATTSAGAVQLLRNALRGLGAGFAIREVLRAVDTYQRMQNQLRVVGYETGQLRSAMGKLFDIAQRTRTPMESIGNLYGKLAQSAGELGRSEAQMLEFTERVGQSLAIQGTNAAGARGALLQLSQAMGEGIVRAQEYNSLVENARPLLLAAAAGIDETGGSVAKLRTMVTEGKITSQEFFDAVLKGGKLLGEQFGKTVPTIGQALTKVSNAWIRFMGEGALGQTILASVSGALIFVAENFDLVTSVAIGAGAAIAAFYGGGILGALISRTATAAGLQFTLAGGFSAVGIAARLVASPIRLAAAAVRFLTAAIIANPIGALAVALIAILTALYNFRNALVTVGNQTASVGSLTAEVWDRTKMAVAGFVSSAQTWLSGLATKVTGWFSSIGVSGKDMGNFLIAVVKSIVDVWVGKWKFMYQVVVAVFKGIVSVGRNVFSGIASALKGNFSDAGKSFGKAFSLDNFNIDKVLATVKETAVKVGGNFGRDFLGEAGAALDAGKEFIAGKLEGVFTAAAARDAAKNLAVQAFEFIATNPAGSKGDGDGGAAKKRKMTMLEEAYKDIVEETQHALEKLVAQQIALDAALINGVINQDQYTLGANRIRVAMAEWTVENTLTAAAIKKTNEEILQLKITAGEGTFADGFLLGLSRMTEGVTNFTASTGQLFANYFETFTDGFANSVGRAVAYSENLGQALDKVAREALAGLISGLVKMGLQWVINAAIGKALGTAATAASAAQAGALAAAWAPAAALASLATSGANAAPANAAIAATLASTKALAMASGFADGGPISGPGGPRDDRIPIWASDGEFMVNAKASKEYRPLLEAINNGTMRRFAGGGAVRTTPTVPASAQAVPVPVVTSGGGSEAPVMVTVYDKSELLNLLASYEGRRVVINGLTEEGYLGA